MTEEEEKSEEPHGAPNKQMTEASVLEDIDFEITKIEAFAAALNLGHFSGIDLCLVGISLLIASFLIAVKFK
jgi:hypothetical protein